MKDSKIATIESPVRRYQFRHHGKTSTLSFDERHLYVQSKAWAAQGTSTYLLHHLSPKVTEETSNEPDATTKVRMSWVLLLAAVVVYFSDYNAHIPLLAPALALLWFIIFASNCRRACPYTWLAIGDDFGRGVAKIRTTDSDDQKEKTRLEAFVHNLIKAIEEAKKSEYFPKQ